MTFKETKWPSEEKWTACDNIYPDMMRTPSLSPIKEMNLSWLLRFLGTDL